MSGDLDRQAAGLGDLCAYVKEEMNVQNLEICNDPLKYAQVKGEPDWKALGKRLGKDMGPVSAVIRALDVDRLLQLEREGSIDIEGHTISSSEIKAGPPVCHTN